MIATSRALSALVVLAVCFAACTKKASPPTPPVPVTVGVVERRAVPFELTATGTVEPTQTVAIQPQVSGPILRIGFREGEDVQKGQVLFQLDPRPFQAALAQAQGLLQRDRAQATNADQEAKRYAALAEKEYVTAQQNDAAQTTAAADGATVAASQAAVDQARLNLQYATIRAPIAGRTGSLRVREGNLVRATDAAPLVTINQIQPILVRFAVPAGNLPAIQRYRRDRSIAVRRPARRRRLGERGHAGVRRQRGGHGHRNDPAQGQLPQHRRRALARRVRERAAPAVRGPERAGGAGVRGGLRAAGQLRLRDPAGQLGGHASRSRWSGRRATSPS